MTALAVAIVTAFLIGADLASDIWVEDETIRHGWDVAVSWALVYAAIFFVADRFRDWLD